MDDSAIDQWRLGAAFISDRGDQYLPLCQQSFKEFVAKDGTFQYTVIDDRHHNLGLSGAVRAAWQWALELDLDYLFHIEEDFVFHTQIDYHSMLHILSKNPQLAQISLKRQADPRGPEESAGGFIELNPSAYSNRETDGLKWTEHRQGFSLNPCFIPRSVFSRGWPVGGGESNFTATCLADGLSFALLGSKSDAPLVEHVGWTRSEDWRL